MNREKANEWIENTFSEWTKENDRQESIFYLVKKIYDDLENRSCDNCKYDWCGCSVQDSILIVDNDAKFDLFCCNKWEAKK